MLKSIKGFLIKKVPDKVIHKRKKNYVKETVAGLGVVWSDVEDLLFWKEPWLSLAVYCGFSAICWKFVSTRLQRLALFLLITISPLLIEELRKGVVKRLNLQVPITRPSLGFDYDDVCDLVVDCWMAVEEHYKYMLKLKEEQIHKFCLHLGSYLFCVLAFLIYVPVVSIIFAVGTVLYFLPICLHLGLVNVLTEKLVTLSRPFYVQFTHSRTKRRRSVKSRKPRENRPSIDSENEAFLPEHNQTNESLLNMDQSHSSFNSSHDEFDLNDQRNIEDMSSEDDAFLPNLSGNAPFQQFASLSQYDSMMEPLQDEFHKDLMFPSIDGSIPVSENEKTDDDVDDLPVDEHQKTCAEFDFVEHDELEDAVDGLQFQDQDASDIVNKVSNLLGY